jgi:hypothetical protein
VDVYALELDQRLKVAQLLDALQKARQTAYAIARDLPDLKYISDEAEALYAKTVEGVGARYQPVYDEQKYIADKIAAGDQLYTEVHGHRLPAPTERGSRGG